MYIAAHWGRALLFLEFVRHLTRLSKLCRCAGKQQVVLGGEA